MKTHLLDLDLQCRKVSFFLQSLLFSFFCSSSHSRSPYIPSLFCSSFLFFLLPLLPLLLCIDVIKSFMCFFRCPLTLAPLVDSVHVASRSPTLRFQLVPAGSAIPQGDESRPGCLGLRNPPPHSESSAASRGLVFWRHMPTIDSHTSTQAASLLAGNVS